MAYEYTGLLYMGKHRQNNVKKSKAKNFGKCHISSKMALL